MCGAWTVLLCQKEEVDKVIAAMSSRNTIKTLAALLLLSVLIMQVIPPVIAQTNATGVQVQLNGPPVIGTLRGGDYTGTIIDPEGRQWSYMVYVDGPNITGASPLEPEALNGTLSPGNYSFSFNITGMQRAGVIDIHVNCTSGNLYYEKVQPIIVVTPITINAEIKNPSNVVVNNVTVQFLVDGVEIEKQVISSIPAMQTKTIFSEWIETDKEPGWHDSTILVDLNGDGVIDIEAGDMIVEDRFFIEGGNDWIFALTVLVGLTLLVVGFGLISRRKIR